MLGSANARVLPTSPHDDDALEAKVSFAPPGDTKAKIEDEGGDELLGTTGILLGLILFLHTSIRIGCIVWFQSAYLGTILWTQQQQQPTALAIVLVAAVLLCMLGLLHGLTCSSLQASRRAPCFRQWKQCGISLLCLVAIAANAWSDDILYGACFAHDRSRGSSANCVSLPWNNAMPLMIATSSMVLLPNIHVGLVLLTAMGNHVAVFFVAELPWPSLIASFATLVFGMVISLTIFLRTQRFQRRLNSQGLLLEEMVGEMRKCHDDLAAQSLRQAQVYELAARETCEVVCFLTNDLIIVGHESCSDTSERRLLFMQDLLSGQLIGSRISDLICPEDQRHLQVAMTRLASHPGAVTLTLNLREGPRTPPGGKVTMLLFHLVATSQAYGDGDPQFMVGLQFKRNPELGRSRSGSSSPSRGRPPQSPARSALGSPARPALSSTARSGMGTPPRAMGTPPRGCGTSTTMFSSPATPPRPAAASAAATRVATTPPRLRGNSPIRSEMSNTPSRIATPPRGPTSRAPSLRRSGLPSPVLASVCESGPPVSNAVPSEVTGQPPERHPQEADEEPRPLPFDNVRRVRPLQQTLRRSVSLPADLQFWELVRGHGRFAGSFLELPMASQRGSDGSEVSFTYSSVSTPGSMKRVSSRAKPICHEKEAQTVVKWNEAAVMSYGCEQCKTRRPPSLPGSVVSTPDRMKEFLRLEERKIRSAQKRLKHFVRQSSFSSDSEGQESERSRRSPSQGSERSQSSRKSHNCPPQQGGPGKAQSSEEDEEEVRIATVEEALPFQGVWAVQSEEGPNGAQCAAWLKGLAIQGNEVTDAQGDHFHLQWCNGDIYIEGGRLFMQDGCLHRQGRSGMVWTFNSVTFTCR